MAPIEKINQLFRALSVGLFLSRRELLKNAVHTNVQMRLNLKRIAVRMVETTFTANVIAPTHLAGQKLIKSKSGIGMAIDVSNVENIKAFLILRCMFII